MAEDELEKVKEKYSKLKQANKVLKEALIDKNEACGRLEVQLKEKDASLRQQLEEIDHLQFQNGRVSKQLGTVSAQLEDVKSRQQGGGWSVGGLITGKQQQDAVQKAEGEIRALKDELNIRMEESESLHMQLFELKREHEVSQQQTREEGATTVKDLECRSKELVAERQQSADLGRQAQELSSEVHKLRGEAVTTKAVTDTLQSTLETERVEAQRRLAGIHAELAAWRPFDEGRCPLWRAWDDGSLRGRAAQERDQAVGQLQACIGDACKQGSNVLRLWTKAFGGGGDEETATRLRVRTKMSDIVEKLAKLIGEKVPLVMGAVDVAHMLPSSTWAGDLREQTATLMQTHRKWVMYQSMLLLHDWNSSYASRSEQEEAQAQRFVEWLWRLHRRVRALFARLRVVSCIEGLQAAGQSSRHFALARRCSRRATAENTPAGAAATAAGSCSGVPLDVAARLVAAVSKALREVLQCWEGIGRCLSAWAMVQASPSAATPQEGGSVVELLEAVHRFSGCLADRVLPAVGKVAAGTPPPSVGGGFLETAAGGAGDAAAVVAPLGRASRSGAGYVGRAALCLARAPAAVGFEEAVQTRELARRLSATSSRLAGEVRQRARRLQAVSDEKAALLEEFHQLQDDHALLRSNLQAVQEHGASPSLGSTAPAPSAALSPHLPRTGPGGDRVGSSPWGSLVLSSRQRALLEGLSVTAQESSSLRQHGYFVEVLNLSQSDVSLASSGPPALSAVPCVGDDAAAAWEVAVRRVYEQHTRLLQTQIQVAEAKTLELNLAVQDNLDRLRKEEEAKQTLRDEAAAVKLRLKSVQDDMESTRKNYDSQLAMLTEHICTLSAKLSDKDSNLAGLHSHKILCGRCGMWNNMGKLMDKDSAGACQTCKEKVLSTG